VIDLPRSTFYYQPSGVTPELADGRLVELIGDIQDDFPGYGYRRVTHELRRRGVTINHKRVSR
jgi:putative transposase